jgi:hypothetical protein
VSDEKTSNETERTAKDRAGYWLHLLTRWRMVFAGWQLGTRDILDPECQAVRDHRELSMLLRAEMNALTSLLIQKGVISEDEWWDMLAASAAELNELMEKRFPGFKAAESGIVMDPKVAEQTMRGWKK